MSLFLAGPITKCRIARVEAIGDAPACAFQDTRRFLTQGPITRDCPLVQLGSRGGASGRCGACSQRGRHWDARFFVREYPV